MCVCLLSFVDFVKSMIIAYSMRANVLLRICVAGIPLRFEHREV